MVALQFMAATGDAALAIDEGAHIRQWNSAAERLLGYQADDVLGRHCYEVLCGEDVFGNSYCSTECPVLSAIRHGRPVRRFEARLKTVSGESLPVQLSTVSIKDGDDVRLCIVHLLHSVSDDTARHAGGVAEATSGRVLTECERKVLVLLADGMGTKDLARSLSISPATARTHIRNIFSKLKVHGRLEAVFKALRAHLI